MLPFEDHGDPRNVVEAAFVKGGRTKEIANRGREKAKQNMLELLEAERRRGELGGPRRSYASKLKASRRVN